MNSKQRKFAAEYRSDRVATQAAIRAGYSPRTAHVQGCLLLKHPKVKAEIERLDAADLERLGVTAYQTLADMREIAADRDQPGSTRIVALKALAKCLGLEAAQKIEHSGSLSGRVVVESVASGVDLPGA